VILVRVPDVPEVSVVIPTRDRWRFLSRHSLPSAFSQEDVELEVVVVDDGSTDETAARLAEHDDQRLRVIRHEQPRGVAAARNAGIAAARGDWVAFLDDDDLWSPRKVRTQLMAAHQAGADFVYAAAVLVDEAKQVIAADVLPHESELLSLLLRGNVVPGGGSGVLARTALIREVGCFDERLSYTEDWDLWIRLAGSGVPAACGDVLVAHVEHSGNALFRYRPDVVSEVEYVLAKYASEPGALPVDAGRRAVLNWLAHEYIRAGHHRQAARTYLEIARERRSVPYAARAVLALSGERGRAFARRARRLLRPAPRGDDPTPPPEPDWLEHLRRRP
jgi:glycosyltransferase involved in cell wall biosynthesis